MPAIENPIKQQGGSGAKNKAKARQGRNGRRKAKRMRSLRRLAAKKDRRVLKSSRGKFKTVAELEAHRLAKR